MSIKIMALAGLLSLGATTAFADTLVTASLVQPMQKPTKVIAADTLWSCDGSTCQTQISDDRAMAGGVCRDLTKQVGALSAYDAGGASFPTDRLAKCNAVRPGQMTAQAR
jgi:hypothetical protein